MAQWARLVEPSAGRPAGAGAGGRLRRRGRRCGALAAAAAGRLRTLLALAVAVAGRAPAPCSRPGCPRTCSRPAHWGELRDAGPQRDRRDRAGAASLRRRRRLDPPARLVLGAPALVALAARARLLAGARRGAPARGGARDPADRLRGRRDPRQPGSGGRSGGSCCCCSRSPGSGSPRLEPGRRAPALAVALAAGRARPAARGAAQRRRPGGTTRTGRGSAPSARSASSGTTTTGRSTGRARGRR